MPANPNAPGPTFAAIFHALGSFGYLYILLALGLTAWLMILFLRSRPLVEYLAILR